MKHIVTLEEFLERLKEKWGDAIEYVSGYKNMNTKCMFKCKIDGRTWFATPHSILQGYGCPVCGEIKRRKSKTLPLEEIIYRIKEMWGDLIEYISGYINTNTKCKWKCTVCNYEWEARPNAILHGTGCPECGHKNTGKALMLPLDKFLKRLKEIWGDLIEYVEDYCGTNKKCKFKCTVCGHVWYGCPSDILRGTGCPKCGLERRVLARILPLEEMLKKLKEVHGDDIEYVSGYISAHKKCKWKCTKCGEIWEATPTSVLRGSGCPFCVKRSMEEPVLKALRNKGIEPIHDKPLIGCQIDGSDQYLRPDFLIIKENGKLCIECDGVQHFVLIHKDREVFKKQQERDKFKNKYLKENGFILIRVVASPTKKHGTDKHITLTELLHLIEIGINKETGEIDFELFKQYDFNRE